MFLALDFVPFRNEFFEDFLLIFLRFIFVTPDVVLEGFLHRPFDLTSGQLWRVNFACFRVEKFFSFLGLRYVSHTVDGVSPTS